MSEELSQDLKGRLLVTHQICVVTEELLISGVSTGKAHRVQYSMPSGSLPPWQGQYTAYLKRR